MRIAYVRRWVAALALCSLLTLAACAPPALGSNGVSRFHRSSVPGHHTPTPGGTPAPHPTPAPQPDGVVVAQGAHTIVGIDARVGHLLWRLALAGMLAPDSAPVVAGKLVIFVGGDNQVRAVDPHTGATVWTAALVAPSALVAGQSAIYLTALPTPGATRRHLYALSIAIGAILWQQDAGALSGTPLLAGGTLFLPQLAPNGIISLSPFDALTGAPSRAITLSATQSSKIDAIAGNLAYLHCDARTLCAVSLASGAVLWRATVGDGARPAVSGGSVFCGGEGDALLALSATTGATLFTARLSGAVLARPLVAGNILYLVTSSRTYVALNARNGALLWHFVLNDNAASAGVLASGAIALPVDGNVVALSAAIGIPLWTYRSTDNLTAAVYAASA